MTVRIINADVMEGLAQLPDESVRACVTSPPYFGLRSYLKPGDPLKDFEIGQEQTPEDFVQRLVEVFREVRRVLRSDGSLWLNIGDCYASSPSKGRATAEQSGKEAWLQGQRNQCRTPLVNGLKAKDLIGIPFMLAFALRADGWWLRSANVWAKPNGMPESTRDRPTVGHEFVFQLTKSADYYYGYDDVKLPPAPESVGRLERAVRGKMDAGSLVISGGGYAPEGQTPHAGARARKSDRQRGHGRRHDGFNDRWDQMHRGDQRAQGAALRSVWWIAPGGLNEFDGNHHAMMPEELAALCVLAGCPAGETVLDPFSGAGTTALVADRLGRRAIGIELNPETAAASQAMIDRDRGGLLDIMESA